MLAIMTRQGAALFAFFSFRCQVRPGTAVFASKGICCICRQQDFQLNSLGFQHPKDGGTHGACSSLEETACAARHAGEVSVQSNQQLCTQRAELADCMLSLSRVWHARGLECISFQRAGLRQSEELAGNTAKYAK